MKETLTNHSVSVLVYSFSHKNFNNNLQNTLYSIDGNAFTFYNKSVFIKVAHSWDVEGYCQKLQK